MGAGLNRRNVVEWGDFANTKCFNMLQCKTASWFNNHSQQVYLEAYLGPDGRSNEHAKEVARKFDRLQPLRDIISAGNFPQKEGLDWGSKENAYMVKVDDTGGVLDILTRADGNFPSRSKLNDVNYVRIAYKSMYRYVKEKLPESDSQGRYYDINSIEPGDKIFVKDGFVFFIRKPGSRFANFGVPLYPWKTQSAPLAGSGGVGTPGVRAEIPTKDGTPGVKTTIPPPTGGGTPGRKVDIP